MMRYFLIRFLPFLVSLAMMGWLLWDLPAAQRLQPEPAWLSIAIILVVGLIAYGVVHLIVDIIEAVGR